MGQKCRLKMLGDLSSYYRAAPQTFPRQPQSLLEYEPVALRRIMTIGTPRSTNHDRALPNPLDHLRTKALNNNAVDLLSSQSSSGQQCSHHL